MLSIPIADGFLTGSLLSLLLPVCLLIAIAIWLVFVVRRVPGGAAGPATSGSSRGPGGPEARGNGASAPAEPPSSEPG